jgi:GTP-binding protein EngB required for normal cell division
MLVLMDARRGDEEEEWVLLRALRELEVPALAVMTKSDKLSKSERLARHHALRKKLAGYVAATVMFSSHTGEGREELWRNVLRLLS